MREYGLIGFPLSHSFSQKYFTEKFRKEDISEAVFTNFPIPEIHAVEEIFKRPFLCGLAVTIPYKKPVMNYLDFSDSVVTATGACNCIKIADGIKSGYNTDVTGFTKSFEKLQQPHHNKALVLGTGGSASAVLYALKQMNIISKSVSRFNKNKDTILYSDLDESILNDYSVIINCTPVGTFPDVSFPGLPYQYLTEKHYLFDLVYNPSLTPFLQKGKERGCTIKNGYEMLELQAEENWRIWNS